ncbi:hypothetical protein [Limosilactobacillus reuteri]|uniref:hypothetical protein n=1 Tax=Limosilactobacillus reuteri TaxID=1598 RepID=UPI00128CFB91|nr:hypothetical protein [Limosilactobacillus reuteri]MQB69410.1 hypothetical protein [Limosilactobacillus reuteri]MQC04757.1 hypothetical protein [Limosilactobacillus reuteri]
MFEEKEGKLTSTFISEKSRRSLDSALNVNGSSASHAYSVSTTLQGDKGFVDVVINVPAVFSIDSELNSEILRILTGNWFPFLSFYQSGPRFIATGTNDFSNGRALRFYFKVGQYHRLTFDTLKDVHMYKSTVPIMEGLNFSLLNTSGHVAISGTSGNGKSAFLEYLISTVWNSFGNKASITVVDPKLDLGLYKFSHDTGIRYISPNSNHSDFFNDVRGVLSEAVDEIHRRQREIILTMKNDFAPYIIAIDEGMAIASGIVKSVDLKEYQSLITQITLMGRSSRVFLWMSAQTFEANTVMNSSSRDQMAMKVLLSRNPGNDARYLFKDVDISSIVIPYDSFNKGVGIISTQPDNRVVPLLTPKINHLW